MKPGDKVRIKREIFNPWRRSWRHFPNYHALVSYYGGTLEIKSISERNGLPYYVIFAFPEAVAAKLGKRPGEEWQQPANFVTPVTDHDTTCQSCNWQHCRGKTNALQTGRQG